MSTDTSEHFVGGMRWRGANATWPFAVLTIDEQGVRVRLRSAILRRMLKRWVPDAVLRWTQIGRVERVRGAVPLPGNEGLRFVIEAQDDSDRLVFWCAGRRRERAVTALRTHGAVITEDGTVW